jgi:hypothetical protein
MRSIPGLSAASAAAFLAGCAAVTPPPREVQDRAATAETYAANLRVSVSGGALRGRTAVLVGFERPDRLRIEIPGGVGPRLVLTARGGRLTAVFPPERAFHQGDATPERAEAILGVGLSPEEIMELLVGRPPQRLVACRVRWGPLAPSRVEADLPSGGRLKISADDIDLGRRFGPGVFEEPPHPGYRELTEAEVRQLWGSR